ncbi:bile acid-CoA:amino acid N-acyltransferase-like [Hoplias malabaricus]|uniref:bile acid-CoA:amino acid N-acyltransferase-like n=1 Tax=Hoplias malabaricus TaxID=27720 RepID=UPI003462D97C
MNEQMEAQFAVLFRAAVMINSVSNTVAGQQQNIPDSLSDTQHVTMYDKVRIQDNQFIWRDVNLPIPADPSMKLDVGQIKCPLLLVNGEDDQNSPTVESAEDMALIMDKAGNRHLLQVLTYPGAGHLIEAPYTPHHRASNFVVQGNKTKVLLLWGGQTKPHSDAQEDSWQKILAFLQQHLYFVA